MTAHRTPERTGTTSDRSTEAPAEELLSLLGDEYTCEILRALGDCPMAARELVEATGMSRPTAYRRLDRLTDAGLVEESIQVAPDGHHRTEFLLAVESIEFELAPGEVSGEIRRSRPVTN